MVRGGSPVEGDGGCGSITYVERLKGAKLRIVGIENHQPESSRPPLLPFGALSEKGY